MRPTTKAVPILLTLAALTSCAQNQRAASKPGDTNQPVTTGLLALEKGASPTPRATTPDPNAQLDPTSIEGMAQRSALDLERALAEAAARDGAGTTTDTSARSPRVSGPDSGSDVAVSPNVDGATVGMVSVERRTNPTGGAESAGTDSQANTGLGALAGEPSVSTGGVEVVAASESSTDQAIESSRSELSALLTRRASTSVAPMSDLGLAAAIAGSEGLPAPELSTLSTGERSLLDAIRTVHASLAAHANGSESGAALDASDTLQAAADRAAQGMPLRIRDAKLCTRVVGFGDYAELNVNAFLAGKPARIVVYTEVDRFATRAGAGGRQTVELSQELDVYHDADGAHCWKRPAQSVSESSRVRRRDFFITNAIELPPTLTVGKYRMKVTMRDLTGNSVAETTIPFTIVADAKLAYTPE